MIDISTTKQRRARHLGRYRQIATVLVKYRLNELIRTFNLEQFLPFHIIPPNFPWHNNECSYAQRTRMALEELGTTFIKVGQILSTRTDVLPLDFTQELSKLQASLTPLPVEVIEKVITDELGRPTRELFASFNPKPVGVASIGQAHAATLHDGTNVIVKVHKPDSVAQVPEDLEILRQLAASVVHRHKGAPQYDLTTLVEEIADTMMGELDYIREGHIAEHYAQFFREDPNMHIPKIFWEYTTKGVITLERIQGISILDVAALGKAGFDRKDLATRSVNIWMKMVFEDTIFHADPHPGNLFVEADGKLGLIDFGMIGWIDDEIRDRLMSAIKGILDRNVDVFIDSLVDLGAVVTMNSRASLRRDLRHIMGHYSDLMFQFNMAYNLGELFAVVRRSHVQLPANTFMLIKAMSMAQSIARGLDPKFNFLTMIEPHVEKIMKEKYSPSAVIRRLPSAVAQLAMFGTGLPLRMDRVVKSVERGEFQVRTDISGLDVELHHLEKVVNRAVIGVMVAAILLALAITGYLGFLLRFLLPPGLP